MPGLVILREYVVHAHHDYVRHAYGSPLEEGGDQDITNLCDFLLKFLEGELRKVSMG